jgi:hypothetical protein
MKTTMARMVALQAVREVARSMALLDSGWLAPWWARLPTHKF